MAVTADQIRDEFPEFAKTSAKLVQAKLGEAALRCEATAYGALYDMAVKYLACHLIAMSPGGEALRIKYPHLDRTQACTPYERTFNDITRTVCGPMVV